MNLSGFRGAALRAALLTGVLLVPGEVRAQQFAIDAEVFGGSASLAWGAEGRRWGFAAGGGVPQIPLTLAPSGADYEEFLHVAAFLRRGAGPVEADVGARLGVAELWECQVSDCWPGGFAGLYATVFAGWRHVKLGARVQAGQFFGSSGRDAFVVGVTPFMLRVAFGG